MRHLLVSMVLLVSLACADSSSDSNDKKNGGGTTAAKNRIEVVDPTDPTATPFWVSFSNILHSEDMLETQVRFRESKPDGWLLTITWPGTSDPASGGMNDTAIGDFEVEIFDGNPNPQRRYRADLTTVENCTMVFSDYTPSRVAGVIVGTLNLTAPTGPEVFSITSGFFDVEH